MTYDAQYALATDATFMHQILVAICNAATAIMAEVSTTAGHSQRASLATRVLNNPASFQQVFAYAVVSANSGLSGPQSDTTVQTTVDSIWNAMAGFSAN